jgi:hypothetical protein
MYDYLEIRSRQHVFLVAALVATAGFLECAPHFLLGLRYQCVLSTITGIRCPFCGMTRDFILMSRGLWPSHNPASLFIALAVYGLYPLWLAIAAFHGKTTLIFRRDKVMRLLSVSLIVLFVCNNLFR